MASMLRPIDGRLKDVITEVANSNKIRVNMTNAKEMMTELNMYQIDVAELGTDTEDDADGEAANEKEFNRLLMGGGVDEEELLARGDVLDQVMHNFSKTDLDIERQRIYDQEMQISQFELDPAVQTCLVDFATKPYAEIDDIQAADDIANSNQVPINYYDNDDGFWDEYIANKTQVAADAGFLTGRYWFKH